MFGRLLSITPPDPYLNIDVGSNKLSNSDITDTSNIVLTDPNTNRSMQLKNYTLEDSAYENVPISIVSSERVSHTELKAGVYRIDALLPGTISFDPNTQDYVRIVYSINLSNIRSIYGKTLSIYLSTPDGKSFGNDGYIRLGENYTTSVKYLVEGLNTYEIPNNPESSILYIVFPSSFYDRDENNNYIQTSVTGCYFVVFPYLNDNKTGFGTYLHSKFNSWSDQSAGVVEHISNTQISMPSDMETPWLFRQTVIPYYIDESIVVFNPRFYTFESLYNVPYYIVNGVHYTTASEDRLLANVDVTNTQSDKILVSNFYGYVYKGDLSTWTSSYMLVYFNRVGLTVTMLPYGYDRFYTNQSFGVSNIYGSIKESDGSNLQIVPGTLITKFKFNASTTNYLYQYSQARIPERLSYTGFIIDGNTGNSEPAFQSALNTSEGITYTNGIINSTILDQDLKNTNTIGALVLYKKGSVNTDKESLLFSYYSEDQILSGFIGALYNLIMFDEDVRLTPWQISYITSKYIE